MVSTKILYYDELDSTNLKAKELAKNGAPEGTVIVAGRQTKGRGRSGRSFFSPDGTGLYMTVILRPSFSPSDASLITTAAAVAVTKAIRTEADKHKTCTGEKEGGTGKCGCGADVWIKWVNDVYVGKRKVCGILTEASFLPDGNGFEYAVCGIGINLFTPPGGFPEDISKIAGALNIKEINAKELALEICGYFFEFYEELTEKRFLPEYKMYMKLTGKRVKVHPGPNESRVAMPDDPRYEGREGVIEELTDELHLIVRFDDGSTEEIMSGEISQI